MTGPVRSVSQAFTILRLLSGGEALSLSEIARALDLSPSSCLNLLRTLTSERAVEQERKRYRIAPGWAGVEGLTGAQASRAVALARPLLADFATRHDAATGLWHTIAGERIVLAALGESSAAMRIHMTEGQRQPIGGGAIGRALAAADGIDEAERARRFAQARWRRPIDLLAWSEQVARAAVQGFGIDDGFAHPGICSLGVVVPGGGALRLFLSASLFAGARTGAEVDAIGRALAQLGSGLAHQLAA
ncbi:MAG: hypothetical protein RIS94_2773 [Pseudomonadota bacterium]|jgi:DNA-binding IclR family transcriptional regulator